MEPKLIDEARRLVQVVKNMKGSQEMTLAVEPPFRTESELTKLRATMEFYLDRSDYKSIEVAGQCLRVMA